MDSSGQLALMDGMEAKFSPCRRYRYELWRTWDDSAPCAVFIGLNPSTADETQDDPTIRRCMRFARDWGFGRLCMLNLFAIRETDPKKMMLAEDPVGKLNDATLNRMTVGARMVVAAWGVHGEHMNRGNAVRRMLTGRLHHLGLTKAGHPKHPLYLKASTRPSLWIHGH